VDLQNRDVGATHSLRQEIADSFNNPDYEVGPIVKSHIEFQKKNANPSKITPKNVMIYFGIYLKNILKL
jgi:chemotaxis methyl-accepting protein methylase